MKRAGKSWMLGKATAPKFTEGESNNLSDHAHIVRCLGRESNKKTKATRGGEKDESADAQQRDRAGGAIRINAHHTWCGVSGGPRNTVMPADTLTKLVPRKVTVSGSAVQAMTTRLTR